MKARAGGACQLAAMIGFTAMLAVAGVIPFRTTPAMGLTPTFLLVSVFKITWWLATAWLLAGLVRALFVFKRQPVETRLLQDLCAGLIYVGATLGIIAYVFDIPISGLLAVSGVIAIVLGLALQSTLGDAFSGIVLNFAKPYHVGDWIILEGGMEGRVIETNWRATQILTPANDLAIVPNSIIAKVRLVNASAPFQTHGVTISVRLDPTTAPLAIVELLETAMLNCTRSSASRPPSSRLQRSMRLRSNLVWPSLCLLSSWGRPPKTRCSTAYSVIAGRPGSVSHRRLAAVLRCRHGMGLKSPRAPTTPEISPIDWRPP